MAIPEDGDTEMVAGKCSCHIFCFCDKIAVCFSEKTFKVYPYLNLDAPYMRDAAATTEEELVNYVFLPDLSRLDRLVVSTCNVSFKNGNLT